MKHKYQLRTQLIHGQYRSKKWDYAHHVVPPMSASATFRLEGSQRGAAGFLRYAAEGVNFDGDSPIYIYDRLDEPTRGMLEDNLATAEGAGCCATFATGMAAISAMFSLLCQQGDEIVAHRLLYGCTYSLLTNWLPRFGIHTKFIDFNDAQALKAAITPRTRVVYCETPVNPTLDLIDITQLRHSLGEAPSRPLLVIDNTFATPHSQRPLSLGADIVVHSLTKGLGGFGTDMGGAILAPASYHDRLFVYRKDFGGVLAPKAAWDFLVYGLPTLATRFDNAQKTAMKIARYLEKHPKVERVSYPGLESFPQAELAHRQLIDPRGRFAPGLMVYFEVKDPAGDGQTGARVIDWIASQAYSITLAVSLGQIKTLIEHPFSMTHSVLPAAEKISGGVHPGGIRLSIGLEDADDLISDLETALAQA